MIQTGRDMILAVSKAQANRTARTPTRAVVVTWACLLAMLPLSCWCTYLEGRGQIQLSLVNNRMVWLAAACYATYRLHRKGLRGSRVRLAIAAAVCWWLSLVLSVNRLWLAGFVSHLDERVDPEELVVWSRQAVEAQRGQEGEPEDLLDLRIDKLPDLPGELWRRKPTGVDIVTRDGGVSVDIWWFSPHRHGIVVVVEGSPEITRPGREWRPGILVYPPMPK